MDAKQLARIMLRRFLDLGHTPAKPVKTNDSGISSVRCLHCSEAAYTTPNNKLDGTALRFTCAKRIKSAPTSLPSNKVTKSLAPRTKVKTHTDLSIKIYREDICEYCGFGTTIVGRGCRYCSNDLPRAYSPSFQDTPPPLLRYRDYSDVIETVLVDRVSAVLPYPSLTVETQYATFHNIPKYVQRSIRRSTGIEQTYRYVVTTTRATDKPYVAPCGCQTTQRDVYYHEDYDSTLTDLMPDTLFRYRCLHLTIEHRSFILDADLLPSPRQD